MSRINHKNFVNLIGYCEEDEPFNRMMVFEYAPNGTVFEHLHGNSHFRRIFSARDLSWKLNIERLIKFLSLAFSVEDMEHLDWNARMRIIMGTAYCLQYMHHDLDPPVAHTNLSSSCIFLTDDYAAKVHHFISQFEQHFHKLTIMIYVTSSYCSCFCR